ncbi:MAG: MEDS domain-containing protein [Bacteroidales bacterium]
MNNNRKITLGFTDQQFEPGVHICQIFNSDEERHGALFNYVVSGLQNGEKTICFSEKESRETLSEGFEKSDLAYTEVSGSGDFSLMNTAEVYFKENKFDPERLLDLLKDFFQSSQSAGYTGARVIGEMPPKINQIEGGARLLEYESKVSMLLRDYPISAVCQYDARLFDGATILDILKVHPYMIVRGSVVNNPFFIQPEEYLTRN